MTQALMASVMGMMMQSEHEREKEAAMSPEELAQRREAKQRRLEFEKAERKRRDEEFQAAHDAVAAPFREARRLRRQQMAAKGCYGKPSR